MIPEQVQMLRRPRVRCNSVLSKSFDAAQILGRGKNPRVLTDNRELTEAAANFSIPDAVGAAGRYGNLPDSTQPTSPKP